jgi:hypothetical protein
MKTYRAVVFDGSGRFHTVFFLSRTRKDSVCFDGSGRFHTVFFLSRTRKDSGLFWMDRGSSTLRSLCRGLVKT